MEWIIRISFLFTGSVLGLFGAIIKFRYKEKLIAKKRFRELFIDDILYIKNYNSDSLENPFQFAISSNLGIYEKEIQIFRSYITKRKTKKLNQAFENLKSPFSDSEMDLLYKKMKLYDLITEDIKEESNLKYSGKEQAIKNLQKLQSFANFHLFS